MSSSLKRKLRAEGVDADKLDAADAAKLARRVPSLAPAVAGRIDARQEWKPLLCGVSGKREDCGRPAGVVLDGLAIAVAGSQLGTAILGKIGNTYTAPELAARVGLCAAHFAAWRPDVALPSLGWGERIEEAPAAVRMSRELARSSGGEKGREHAASDRDGAGDGPRGDWSGSRRVGRRRAAGDAAAPVTKPERIERRGFLQEVEPSGVLGLVHGADRARCKRATAARALKVRKLTRVEYDAVARCTVRGCCAW